jgi:hypothetical protein
MAHFISRIYVLISKHFLAEKRHPIILFFRETPNNSAKLETTRKVGSCRMHAEEDMQQVVDACE